MLYADPASGIVTSRRADRRFEDLGPSMCADLDGGPGYIPKQPDDRNCCRANGIPDGGNGTACLLQA